MFWGPTGPVGGGSSSQVNGSLKGSDASGGGGMGDTPVAQWLMNDAKQRLQETLVKLNLDS